jgi:thymidylate kinase (EC 2.7.4.9)
MTRPDSSLAPGQTLRGKFISLEGGEGAGKSTLLAGMRQFIEQRGVGLVLTASRAAPH